MNLPSNKKIFCALGAAVEVLTALGNKMPTGIWAGTKYWFLANQSSMNKNFVKAYKNSYGVYPSYNAEGAYGAVYTYKAAAEKAKSTDKEDIINTLPGMTVEIPAGRILIRKEDHQAVIDGCWGKTAYSPDYPIEILKPYYIFKGTEITPPVKK